MDIVFLAKNVWWVLPSMFVLIFFLVCLKRRYSPASWRGLEIAALLLGAVGLLPPVFQAQSSAYNLEVRLERGWTFGHLNNYLKVAVGTMTLNCNLATRSEFSPLDFDLLQQERIKVCDWSTDLLNHLSKFNKESMAPLSDNWKANFPSVREVPVGYTRDGFFDIIDEWNVRIREFKELEKNENILVPSGLIFISPFLLFAAFSIVLSSLILKPKERGQKL